MRIGIAGTGGVGGLLGGFLARHGADVALLARGAHRDALRERGLQIDGQLGQFTVTNVTVSDRGSELGACDVVFVATKTWQLEAILPHVRGMMGANTTVVPLLNGITAWDQLARDLGDGSVVGGAIFCNSWVDAPGVIKQIGSFVRVVTGERGGGASARLVAIRDLITAAGLTGEINDNIVTLLWEKFLGFEPMALVGALSRSTIGTYRHQPEVRAVLVALMEEVIAIGRKKGVSLSADVLERRMKIIDSLAQDATISMQRDLMRGKQSEFMEHSIGLLALAKSLGIATPVHDICVPLLLLQEQAARAHG